MISFFRNLTGNNVNNTPPPPTISEEPGALSEKIRNLFKQEEATLWNINNRDAEHRPAYQVKLDEIRAELNEIGATEEDRQRYQESKKGDHH